MLTRGRGVVVMVFYSEPELENRVQPPQYEHKYGAVSVVVAPKLLFVDHCDERTRLFGCVKGH